jgi:RNA polymerase sigma-70 factor (ECF subfamily)
VFRWAAAQVRGTVRETTWNAFWQSTVNDHPIEVVAAELQMTVGSVYIARSRVMARLRETVQRFDGESND